MSNIFASKTNNAFYQTVFMAVAALAAMAFVTFKVYQLSSLYLAVLIHKIKDACGCTDMAQFFSMHPDIFRAVILFGIGIGVFIFYSLYKLVKLISRTRKYIAYYLSFAAEGHSKKLKAAIKALGLDGTRVVEINRSDLAVFCFGFLEPKICISRALVEILDRDELSAVLAHEAQHMDSYEPMKIFIVKYARSIFFFLPGMKNFAKKYITFSELAADEKAGESAMTRSKLASAILKISEQEENRSVIFERANRMIDADYIPEFKSLDKGLIAGSLGLAIISLFILIVFSNSTKAFEMHHISVCISQDNSKKDLACSVAGQQENASINNDIFNNLESADTQQNFTCNAEVLPVDK